jgi:hypothetical protein
LSIDFVRSFLGFAPLICPFAAAAKFWGGLLTIPVSYVIMKNNIKSGEPPEKE